jgi:hypothetical protein
VRPGTPGAQRPWPTRRLLGHGRRLRGRAGPGAPARRRFVGRPLGTPGLRVAPPRRRGSCSIALAEPWSRWPPPTCTGGACAVAGVPITDTATGTGSHLVRFTATYPHCVNFAANTFSGTARFKASNGDLLFVRLGARLTTRPVRQSATSASRHHHWWYGPVRGRRGNTHRHR